MQSKRITTSGIELGLPLSFDGSAHVCVGDTRVRVDADFVEQLWDAGCTCVFHADVHPGGDVAELVAPSRESVDMDLALFEYKASVPIGYRIQGGVKVADALTTCRQTDGSIEYCLSVLAAMPDGSLFETVATNVGAVTNRIGVPNAGAIMQYGHKFVRRADDWWVNDELNVLMKKA